MAIEHRGSILELLMLASAELKAKIKTMGKKCTSTKRYQAPPWEIQTIPVFLANFRTVSKNSWQ